MSFPRKHLTLTTNLTATRVSFKRPALPLNSRSSPQEVRDDESDLRADLGKEGETVLVIEEVKLWRNLARELSFETLACCARTQISAGAKQRRCGGGEKTQRAERLPRTQSTSRQTQYLDDSAGRDDISGSSPRVAFH